MPAAIGAGIGAISAILGLISNGGNTAVQWRNQSLQMQRQQQELASQSVQQQCLPPGKWIPLQDKTGRIIQVCLPPSEQH